jgi:hypothetical protein
LPLLSAEDSRVQPQLNLVGKKLGLISASAIHGLPVKVLNLEWDLCLPLLESEQIRE